MNDEEKKVIDLLKNIDKQKCVMLECPVVKNNIERQLKIIELNRIIRKQSKEIESLKEDNKKKSIVIIEYQDLYEKWEDKIKEKIEVLEKLQKEFPNNDEIRIKIIAYKELLEKE